MIKFIKLTQSYNDKDCNIYLNIDKIITIGIIEKETYVDLVGLNDSVFVKEKVDDILTKIQEVN